MGKIDYTKLKALREEKGITQKGMSDLLNMTQSNYSKLEKGQKKNDSIQTIENLSKALKMPRGRLIGVLTEQENIQSSGMQVTELLQVEELLKDKPLREDEFVFFSAEVLDVEKYQFKAKYSGLNLNELNDDEPFPMWQYPPVMNIMISSSVEIGFEYNKAHRLKNLSVWLGNKKLGTIPTHYHTLVDQLIKQLLISRVVLIGNEDGIPGYFDTYMKVVFIATNAVCKSSEFKKGRFSSLKFLSKEEIEKIDDEALETENEQ